MLNFELNFKNDMKRTYIYYLLLLYLGLHSIVAGAASVQPFAQLLAWRAAESNACWATTFTSSGNTTHVTQSNLNFNTRVGVKAGLLYAPGDCFWDTKFYWTYLPTSATKNIPVGDKVITSLFFSGSFFISEDLFFGARANWDLVMNMFDLEASHHFKPTQTLTFTPKIGLKAGSINQDINIVWNAVLYKATENVTNHFNGLGPSFGLETKLNFYKELSLFADISTAFMYGRWNVTDTYHRPSILGVIAPTTITTRMNHAKLGTLMMDYFLGLEWLHQGRSCITLQLGYEMQYWANQLRFVAVQQLPTLGDLTLQGGTCGLSIDW